MPRNRKKKFPPRKVPLQEFDWLCRPWSEVAPWDRDERGQSIVDTWKPEPANRNPEPLDAGLIPKNLDEEERAVKWLESLDD